MIEVVLLGKLLGVAWEHWRPMATMPGLGRQALLIVAGYLVVVHLSAAFAQTPEPPPQYPPPPPSPAPPPPPGPPAYNSIWDVIADRPDLSTLRAALTQLFQQGSYNDSTTAITGFLPTNAAFEKFALSLNLTGVPGLAGYSQTLFEAAKYHSALQAFTISGLVAAAGGAAKTTYFDTRLGSGTYMRLAVDVSAGGEATALSTSSRASFVETDIVAGSSYVNIIDTFLQFWYPTIDEALKNTEGITTLYKALGTADLIPTLSSLESVSSLFAPVDQAFVDAQASYGIDFSSNTDTLLHHVVPQGVALNRMQYVRQWFPTLNNIGVVVNGGADTSGSGNSTVTTSIEGCPVVNVIKSSIPVGIAPIFYIHVIDKLLVPTYTTTWQYLANNSEYDIFRAFVKLEPDVLNVLQNQGQSLTVFAPNNKAMLDLAAAYRVNDIVVSLDKPRRQAILKNQVATRALSLGNLGLGQTLDTLYNAGALRSGSVGGGVMIVAEASLALVISPNNVSILYGKSYVNTVAFGLVPASAAPGGSSSAAAPSQLLLLLAALLAARWVAL